MTQAHAFNVTVAGTVVVAVGPGALQRVVVNTAVASGVVTLYDGSDAAATTKIATITYATLKKDPPRAIEFGVRFTTGLVVTTTAATNMTIVYEGAQAEVPAQLPGLIGWWDFTDTTKLYAAAGDGARLTADGQAIYEIRDKSGNGKHASNSTLAMRATYKSDALSGRGAGRFTGDFGAMETAGGFTATQPNTFFAVGNTGNNAAFNCFFDGGLGTRQALFYNNTGGHWEIFAGTILSGPLADTSPHIFACTFNGASSKLWVGGGAPTTGNAGTDGLSSGINLGNTQPGGFLYLSGDLGEVLAYSGALSTTTLDLVGNYLAKKYRLPWTAAS